MGRFRLWLSRLVCPAGYRVQRSPGRRVVLGAEFRYTAAERKPVTVVGHYGG